MPCSCVLFCSGTPTHHHVLYRKRQCEKPHQYITTCKLLLLPGSKLSITILFNAQVVWSEMIRWIFLPLHQPVESYFLLTLTASLGVSLYFCVAWYGCWCTCVHILADALLPPYVHYITYHTIQSNCTLWERLVFIIVYISSIIFNLGRFLCLNKLFVCDYLIRSCLPWHWSLFTHVQSTVDLRGD